jgi:hypothetical protein
MSPRIRFTKSLGIGVSSVSAFLHDLELEFLLHNIVNRINARRIEFEASAVVVLLKEHIDSSLDVYVDFRLCPDVMIIPVLIPDTVFSRLFRTQRIVVTLENEDIHGDSHGFGPHGNLGRRGIWVDIRLLQEEFGDLQRFRRHDAGLS